MIYCPAYLTPNVEPPPPPPSPTEDFALSDRPMQTMDEPAGRPRPTFEPIENRVDVNDDKFVSSMDDIASSFSISLRDNKQGKYYNKDLSDIIKDYTLRLTDKQKNLIYDENGNISLVETVTFPRYDLDGETAGSIKKQSIIQVANLDLSNIRYISEEIASAVESDPNSFLEESIVSGQQYQDEPDRILGIAKAEVYSIVSSRAMAILDELLSEDTLAQILSNKDLEQKYQKLLKIQMDSSVFLI